MTRAIFFDIDGCFSTSAFKQAHGNAMIDPQTWDAFVATARRVDAQIVMNSTWRRPAILTGTDPRLVLPAFALNAPFHDDPATPWIDDGGRGDWALAWLARHPDIDDFAFLDDEPPHCLLPQNAGWLSTLLGRWIAPDPADGVRHSDLSNLVSLFKDVSALPAAGASA